MPGLGPSLAGDEETESCGDGALSAEGPEALSQAFDPNLCAQLPPAATSLKLLSSGTCFSTKASATSSLLSLARIRVKTNSHSWLLAALQTDIKWQKEKWFAALSFADSC